MSFSVGTGECLGLLDPNGAEKTAVLSCLVGLRRPTKGSVRICGENPAAISGVSERSDRANQCAGIPPHRRTPARHTASLPGLLHVALPSAMPLPLELVHMMTTA
ncbi:ATP-binding cassette domain-containing protein [Actinomyces bovis]|uniref:ATP-binding cassette domain-containing protein n=1 Tax=Actinomyces bovis TaxID=1658 RepID=UPI0038993A69